VIISYWFVVWTAVLGAGLMRGKPIGNRRYGRVTLCATGEACGSGRESEFSVSAGFDVLGSSDERAESIFFPFGWIGFGEAFAGEGEVVLVLLLAEGEGLFGEFEFFGGELFAELVHVAFEGEVFAAEVGFLFLDFGMAFADGGVAGAADDFVEVVEGAEVVGVAVAVVSEGEVEGLLFEEFEGVGGEGGVAGGGVLAEFGGGLAGEVEGVDLAEKFGPVAVTYEGHVGDFFLEFGAAKLDDFTAGDSVFEPGNDVFELALGEGEETGERAARTAGRGRFEFRVSGFEMRSVVWD
jgi:hypothetical protein